MGQGKRICIGERRILTHIYSDDFRHSYAKISTRVQSILEEDIDKGECLSQNLQLIKKAVETRVYNKKISTEICDKVRKLCDHVNLEIGRYNLIVNKIEASFIGLQENHNNNGTDGPNVDAMNKRMSDIEKNMEGVRNNAYNIQKELDKVDGRLERNSLTSITTLTIFS